MGAFEPNLKKKRSNQGTKYNKEKIGIKEKKTMFRYYYALALITLLFYVSIASAQDSHPIMEKIAQKVIQKYQTSSCEQLAMERSQPPTGEKAQMEQNALEILQNNPQMRAEFINRVAGPIANKLFECGMIP
jgi:hypothetical protein